MCPARLDETPDITLRRWTKPSRPSRVGRTTEDPPTPVHKPVGTCTASRSGVQVFGCVATRRPSAVTSSDALPPAESAVILCATVGRRNGYASREPWKQRKDAGILGVLAQEPPRVARLGSSETASLETSGNALESPGLRASRRLETPALGPPETVTLRVVAATLDGRPLPPVESPGILRPHVRERCSRTSAPPWRVWVTHEGVMALAGHKGTTGHQFRRTFYGVFLPAGLWCFCCPNVPLCPDVLG